MLLLTIDNEVPVNVARNRISIYEEFTGRTETYIADQCKEGVLKKTYENPVNRAQVFFDLIETQYLGPLREVIETIKALFARHDIGFRLYDIHHCLHGYHSMTMLWVMNTMEYRFHFLWDSAQHNPFDSFYQLALVNRCGDVINGDILHDTRQFFDEGDDLPEWFISGLQHNS